MCDGEGTKPETVMVDACPATLACEAMCLSEDCLGPEMTTLIADLRSSISDLETEMADMEIEMANMETEMEADYAELETEMADLKTDLEDAVILVTEDDRKECWDEYPVNSNYEGFVSITSVNVFGGVSSEYELCILNHTKGSKSGTKEWAFFGKVDDRVYPTCVQMTLGATGGDACHPEYECNGGIIGYATQQRNKLSAIFDRMRNLMHWKCPSIQDECIHISFTGADELGYTALADEVGEKMGASPGDPIDGYQMKDFFCVGKDELVKVRDRIFGLVPICLTWQTNKGALIEHVPEASCEDGVPYHVRNVADWEAVGGKKSKQFFCPDTLVVP
eukprot:UN22758